MNDVILGSSKTFIFEKCSRVFAILHLCLNTKNNLLFWTFLSSKLQITYVSTRKSKNKYDETEVRKICQNQKILSDDEIKQIIQGYERGLSTYKLAKQFNCHRYTIANTLKKKGIEVTNQCAKKKVLAEMIMQMYSEWYKPQEIGEALGVSADTVRRILKQNNVYIRKSWEYPRKKQ